MRPCATGTSARTAAGRVVAVAGDPDDVTRFYFGSTGGGVWKTDDGGQIWENISDGFFKYASVGAIQVSESDPNVIYVGMGEATIRGNVSRGDGIYKSTDRGRTWQHKGLAETQNIGELQIHPENPDIVYVAALGHVWGENPERGIYRSTDGGDSWELILKQSDKAGRDRRLDPTNPESSTPRSGNRAADPLHVERRRWSPVSGARSTAATPGKTSPTTRDSRKASSARSPWRRHRPRRGRVYAIVEAEDGGVFRSDDYGDSWVKGSDDRNLRQRAWYYHHIYADPGDADTVWVLNVEMWKSIDGGKTFQQVSAPHGDNHDLWIDPANPQRMILGNDGGGLVSYNGGYSWSTMYNQMTAEFYHVATDSRFPYRVYGAQQDNTTMSVPSRSDFVAIVTPDWRVVGGGESGYIAVDQDDPDIIYAGAQTGRMTRLDLGSGHAKNITVWPEPTAGRAAGDLAYRWNWTSPIHLSPHDSKVLYSGGNHLFRSTDGGQSWSQASPDLSRADPETLGRSGGPITGDNTGAEIYGTIFAFAESPVEAGVLWAGSDDGLVHVSRDNGENWTNVNPPDLPDWALISIIEASPHKAGKAFVVATRYKSDDERPYIYKTEDYGETWTEAINGLPWDPATGSGAYTRVVREDPEREGLLFCGTELGLFISFDDGENWEPFQLNLPVTPIHDLLIKGNDLVVGTHGRSFWILDDITPVRHASADAGDVRIFQPGPTIRYPRSRDFGPHPPRPGINYSFAGGFIQTYTFERNDDGTTEVTFTDAGNNPVDGLVLRYWLASEPDGKVELDFLDSDGRRDPEVFSEAGDREEAADSASAGSHRFVWDMRYPGATQVQGGDASARRGGAMAQGPTGARNLSGPARRPERLRDGQLRDPQRSAHGDLPGDYQAQFDLMIEIRDTLSDVNDGVNRIRSAREQLDGWAERGDEDMAAAAKDLSGKLLDIEDKLIQYRAKSLQDTLHFPGRLTALLGGIGGVVAGA
ncbi:MAG: glycosyl hydrolase [Thermomicrobiales bacterium]